MKPNKMDRRPERAWWETPSAETTPADEYTGKLGLYNLEALREQNLISEQDYQRIRSDILKKETP
jgi:hypothetical protein